MLQLWSKHDTVGSTSSNSSHKRTTAQRYIHFALFTDIRAVAQTPTKQVHSKPPGRHKHEDAHSSIRRFNDSATTSFCVFSPLVRRAASCIKLKKKKKARCPKYNRSYQTARTFSGTKHLETVKDAKRVNRAPERSLTRKMKHRNTWYQISIRL